MTDSDNRSRKSSSAFRTISEVAKDLDLPQHVLRFWETKFSQVKPVKRGGGRRYYRPEDVALLNRIKQLLYSDGYTIKGVQKLFRDESQSKTTSSSENTATSETAGGAGEDNTLLAAIAELEDL
ncbi:MAG: MerR family transcriptional regulator, partial [Alphaproteobacteria bacterium]|nr:MerR family transcriptional regulator [Alphaproteobacteria bacterium]